MKETHSRVLGRSIPARACSGEVRSNTRRDGSDARPLSTSPPAVNLAAYDLNLLVALEALLEQRHVTYAGRQIGLSQPAMSRALGRLREIFNDDLLVRTSSGMTLTARGEQLRDKVPAALSQISEILTEETFVPGEMRTAVGIALAEHTAMVLLPHLMPRLINRAPNVQIVTHSLVSGAIKRLEMGEIDFTIGQVDDTPAGFYRRLLYSDRFVCLLRHDHPVLLGEWTVDTLSSLRHAVFSPGAEDGFGQIYDFLARYDCTGEDALMVPSLATAPMLIAETNLVLILPYRVAKQMARIPSLAIRDLPMETLSYDVSLIWHERSHRNEKHRWLRSEIAASCMAAVPTEFRSN